MGEYELNDKIHLTVRVGKLIFESSLLLALAEAKGARAGTSWQLSEKSLQNLLYEVLCHQVHQSQST